VKDIAVAIDENLFKGYRDFIETVDELCRIIHGKYGDELSCGPGCDECCEAGLSLFPVEALYIRHHLDTSVIGDRAHDPDRCVFLKEGLCSVYAHRPLICRTQGYPLLYGSQDNENDMEVSFCDLNFTETESVGEDDLLDMDRLNMALAVINLRFLNETGLLKDLRDRRIAMADIASR